MKEIITKYKYRVQTIIRNFTGSNNEDIEQEIYIKTWKNMPSYSEQNKFLQWISTITANACKDYLKKKRIETISDDEILENTKDNSNIENEVESKERQKRILNEINKLPRKLKDVVVYYELEDKSYEEISVILSIPQGTVKSRLFKAREVLKESLQDLLN